MSNASLAFRCSNPFPTPAISVVASLVFCQDIVVGYTKKNQRRLKLEFYFAFPFTVLILLRTHIHSERGMFRMVKLLRLSRMAKLLHAVPELTIIMKGINLATRSVPWSGFMCIAHWGPGVAFFGHVTTSQHLLLKTPEHTLPSPASGSSLLLVLGDGCLCLCSNLAPGDRRIWGWRAVFQ